MSETIGLALHDDRIDCVVLRRGLGRARVRAAFSLPAGESVGARLGAKLRELSVKSRVAHVGLPRRRAVVKLIELPGVSGVDLRQMVGFELERHVPFGPDDTLFDFHVVEARPGGPVRVLLVAVERRTLERVEQFVRDAGLSPRLVDVAIHSLARSVGRATEGGAAVGHLHVHVDGAEAELALMRDGVPRLSRAFSLPPDQPERGRILATEIERSLAGLRAADRDGLTRLTLSGAPVLPDPPVAGLSPAPLAGPPTGVSGLPEGPGFLPALAMALRQATRGRLRTNLLPASSRPRPFPWAVAATAALAVFTLGLGLGIPAVRAYRERQALAGLERALAALAPRVQEVERLAKSVESSRRELEAFRGFEAQHVRLLPVLRELTELLPGDVWLTNLSIDGKGIELAGFAASASQLIPLLEGSGALEGVEFTSPVTKGRDREQFRLKAAWERPARGPAGPTRAGPSSARPSALPRSR